MTAPAEPTDTPNATRLWTTRELAGRALWYAVEGTVFRHSPRTLYGFRTWLLRRFGADVHPTARLRPTVTIEVPWHLSIGEHTMVGDHAILYCLGRVRIGARCTVSQYAHLCAGTHDHTQPAFPLIKADITLGDDVWIAADAYVGPNVSVGDGVVLGARSSAFGDLPPWTICVGLPARPVKPRVLQDRSPGA